MDAEQIESETIIKQHDSEDHQCPFSEHLLMADLAAKLQKDNERLDTRLRSVTKERNALIKDRQELEETIERLRQEGIEKDRQLLALLSRRD